VLPEGEVKSVLLLEGEGWGGAGQTSLHGNETRPGIVGAAVAQARHQAACYDGYICMFDGDVGFEMTQCRFPAARGFSSLSIDGGGLCSWQSVARFCVFC